MKKLFSAFITFGIFFYSNQALATDRPLLSFDDPLWFGAMTAAAYNDSDISYAETCDDQIFFQYSDGKLISATSLSGENVTYNYSNELLYNANLGTEYIYFEYNDDGYLGAAYVTGGERVEFDYSFGPLREASILFDESVYFYRDVNDVIDYGGIMGGDRVFFANGTNSSTILCPTVPTNLTANNIGKHKATLKWDLSANADYYMYEFTTYFKISGEWVKSAGIPLYRTKNKVKLDSLDIYPNTKSSFRVQACSDYSRSCSEWSKKKKFNNLKIK